jgi:glyoxylate/hydroxypyruvate reductase A
MNLFISIDDFDESQIQRIRDVAADAILLFREDYSDDASLQSEFETCEIVFGNVPAHWLDKTTTLRWAQLDSVGFGEYRSLNWEHLSQQITLTNLAGFFSDPVAQTALAGILALYRGIDKLTVLQHNRSWNGDPLRTQLRTLTGANVVLFGYGAINRRFAQLLSAFECSITTFGTQWTSNALDDALESADVLVTTVPETDGTVGLFNAQRLSLLRNDALFVNCGRGSVVDESALVEQLNKGQLGGAVVDVTIEEPLPPDHAFWTTPNLLLTQHTGGGTRDELDRKITVFSDNLTRYKQQQPLQGVVDFKRGY